MDLSHSQIQRESDEFLFGVARYGPQLVVRRKSFEANRSKVVYIYILRRFAERKRGKKKKKLRSRSRVIRVLAPNREISFFPNVFHTVVRRSRKKFTGGANSKRSGLSITWLATVQLA